ncbi:hypothetical protein P2H44_22895 [Albimonas sp. CAU 1670]|uniref:hypothetical protein n=1 Tax=Albimonas sp. CAU 1670 TaxID=3032599 RepID=UPI0023DAB1ED|nr:hypothetical protein [Albimonas sp. CAU 1670]MDF2235413.1 hypothetical protein [Albimonas sp. CAU 1670]
MADARVATCRVRGAQGAAGRLAALAADALRTAPEPGGRLLLLRRLDLGLAAARGAGGDPARAALARRAEESLRRAALGAVHGGAPHAGAAGAVWFRDAAEARRLLLLRRAAGAPLSAWFWRLAVPGAARLARDPAPGAAAALLAEAAVSDEAELELARLLRAAPEAGVAVALTRLLLAAAGPAPGAPLAMRGPAGTAGDASHVPVEDALKEAEAETARLLRAAPEAVERGLRQALRTAAEADGAPPRWLRRAALLALAPGLAAAPRRLEALAEGVATPPGRGEGRARAQGEGSGVVAQASLRSAPGASPGAEAAAPGATTREAEAGRAASRPAEPAALPTPAEEIEAEAFSPSAGLLLALTPLRKAGFAEWLAERPDLARRGFGPAFVLHLAQVHARGASAVAGGAGTASRRPVAPRQGGAAEPRGDPLLDALTPWPPVEAADPAAARAWRQGLDGWLRRRAGRGLHDLAARGGWLLWSDGRIEARFPAAAADLALRRRGLDADPGWVPWLGRSVRYHFRDEPL